MNYWKLEDGCPFPFGVSLIKEGKYFNFALYSKNATDVTLYCYSRDDFVNPILTYEFDHFVNKTERIWHCAIPAEQLEAAEFYAYRVDGPHRPEQGDRFDKEKIILDPWCKAVYFPPNFSRLTAARKGNNAGQAPLGILPKVEVAFDWEDDYHPRHTSDLVIYEMHIRGFTQRENSGVSEEHRGTFSGVIDKIPYLKELGITAVEFLPVHQYDPQEGNYWGYMTLNFFAPHHLYSQHPEAHEQLYEFKEMVKALHQADIEVLLDVVYNHTTEGDQNGPTYSYRAIDNSTYYLLTPDKKQYINDAGTGNVMRTSHPHTRKMVLDSLRHWVEEMHVDGFRFDLASIFARKDDGSVNLSNPPIIAQITSDPTLASTRLIAEPWDVTTYLLGYTFPGINWMQWNGKFRDNIRRFVKGDPGLVGALMTRLYGSSDLYPDTLPSSYRPFHSVNFITAHDGFCLYDLVSYNVKHNEANGNNNTDGTDSNFSWNCGYEGDKGVPPQVLHLRKRQIKNFFALLMLANGTPMFYMGDEFMNTQKGNNNPYNQDNETTWLDWDLLEKNRDMFRFFQKMIAFRKAHPSIARGRFWREDVRWYGRGKHVEFNRHSHSLAYCLHGESMGDQDIYVMINAFWKPLKFTVQEGQPHEWLRVVDTFLASPKDIVEEAEASRLTTLEYAVQPRSVAVLVRDN